jgi:pilus assembly protein CpaE
MDTSSASVPIRVVITEANPGSADELRETLMRVVAGGRRLHIVGYARDGLDVAQMAAHARPDLMFVDTEMPGIDGFEACKLAVAANPDTICVMVAEAPSMEVHTAAMRAGARGVLDLQQSETALRTLVDQLMEVREAKLKPEFAIATDPEKMPISIAVTSARGGAGKTTVATNLSALLARRYPKQAVLVDYFGQFGNVALSLDLHPNIGIGDLLGYQELDVDLVESHLISHESGLKVLAGVSRGSQEGLSRIEVPQLASLLGMLRRRNRFTIFDIPPLLWPSSPYILSRCQHILLVATLDDIGDMRDTAALLDIIMNANVPLERIKLVVNRVGKETELNIRDLEESTGMKIWARLPNDYGVANAARNEGVPCVIGRPREALSRAYSDMLDRLLQDSGAPAARPDAMKQ